MSEPDLERARRAFTRLVEDLRRRGATGRAAMAFEVTDEFASAFIESGAREQQEAEISDVRFQFFENAAAVSLHVRVKGQAWPPRPPVNTQVDFAARDITHSEAGKSGSITFRVEKPLTFSSTFADVIIGLAGKLLRSGPISIDALRHKDALVTLDFARIVEMNRPELAGQVSQIRLYGLKVSMGRARADVGFVK